MLARITSSGRGDFSVGSVTLKYTAGPTMPAFVANGHAEIWYDTGSGTGKLVVGVNGVNVVL